MEAGTHNIRSGQRGMVATAVAAAVGSAEVRVKEKEGEGNNPQLHRRCPLFFRLLLPLTLEHTHTHETSTSLFCISYMTWHFPASIYLKHMGKYGSRGLWDGRGEQLDIKNGEEGENDKQQKRERDKGKKQQKDCKFTAGHDGWVSISRGFSFPFYPLFPSASLLLFWGLKVTRSISLSEIELPHTHSVSQDIGQFFCIYTHDRISLLYSYLCCFNFVLGNTDSRSRTAAASRVENKESDSNDPCASQTTENLCLCISVCVGKPGTHMRTL